MKKISLTLLPILLIAAITNGALYINITEISGSTLFSGSGSANLSALQFEENVDSVALIFPEIGNIGVGPPIILFEENSIQNDRYSGALADFTDFGNGNFQSPTSGSGHLFGYIGFTGHLSLPSGYISGENIESNSRYESKSLSDLGLEEGIYNVTWGEGSQSDLLRISVSTIPETSYFGLIIFTLLLACWKRR